MWVGMNKIHSTVCPPFIVVYHSAFHRILLTWFRVLVAAKSLCYLADSFPSVVHISWSDIWYCSSRTIPCTRCSFFTYKVQWFNYIDSVGS